MAIDKQKGVSLIITFFIMIIILAVILSITVLLYSEIKVMRNIGNSMVSFYAADSGVEKVLYYDDKVLPTYKSSDGKDIAVKRGLCSMFDSINNLKYCPSTGSSNSAIYCTSESGYQVGTTDATGKGCDPSVCDDCSISFSTNFDGRTYYTTATVTPATNDTPSGFSIESKGTYGGAGRQIQIFMNQLEAPQAIKVERACVEYKSYLQGASIYISAGISSTVSGDSIGDVTATIKNKNGSAVTDGSWTNGAGQTIAGGSNIKLLCTNGIPSSCTWSQTWNANARELTSDYTVDLDIKDNFGPTDDNPNQKQNEVILPNILPCEFLGNTN